MIAFDITSLIFDIEDGDIEIAEEIIIETLQQEGFETIGLPFDIWFDLRFSFEKLYWQIVRDLYATLQF